MLHFIDFLNDSNILTEKCMLVRFDIVNMFPSIDNESVLQALKNALEAREEQFPPTLCIIEALELCLKCNNSIFNKRHFLQNDGTDQGPHMSCSYGDIAIEQFDEKALKYNPAVIGRKRFRDDIYLVWPHSAEDLNLFFNYMNSIDRTKKIQFTMEVAKDVSDFLDLRLKFDKEYKRISVDTFVKLRIISHTYFPAPVFLRTALKTFLKVLHYD